MKISHRFIKTISCIIATLMVIPLCWANDCIRESPGYEDCLKNFEKTKWQEETIESYSYDDLVKRFHLARTNYENVMEKFHDIVEISGLSKSESKMLYYSLATFIQRLAIKPETLTASDMFKFSLSITPDASQLFGSYQLATSSFTFCPALPDSMIILADNIGNPTKTINLYFPSFKTYTYLSGINLSDLSSRVEAYLSTELVNPESRLLFLEEIKQLQNVPKLRDFWKMMEKMLITSEQLYASGFENAFVIFSKFFMIASSSRENNLLPTDLLARVKNPRPEYQLNTYSFLDLPQYHELNELFFKAYVNKIRYPEKKFEIIRSVSENGDDSFELLEKEVK